MAAENVYDREYYEGGASNYGDYGGYASRLFGISRLLIRRKAFSIIRKHRPGGSLLDIGCAYGFLVNSASRLGFDASGVDISGFAVGEARKRFPGLDIRRMDIEEGIDLPCEGFDVVTAMDVLEHCSNLGRALSNISSIMKDDAILLISVPDSDLFPEEKDRDDTHVWRMNMEGWTGVFRESGFEVVETYVFPRWLKRILPAWCVSMALLRKAA